MLLKSCCSVCVGLLLIGIVAYSDDGAPTAKPAAPAQGNAAFLYQDGQLYTYALATDGSVWWRTASVPYECTPSGPPIPMPVSEVASWHRYSLLTKDGVVWKIIANTWVELPPVPIVQVSVEPTTVGEVKKHFRE